MAEFKTTRDWHDKEKYNYLVIYQFRKRLANIAFDDLIESNFKDHHIPCDIENVQSFYLSIPLNREKLLYKFKNLISQINTYFEYSDFLYIVSNLSASLNNTEEGKTIILGHDVISGQDKIWSDIVNQYKK